MRKENRREIFGRIFRRALQSAWMAAALGALAFLVFAGTVEAQEAGYLRIMARNGQWQGASTNPMYKGWIVIRSVASAPSAADRESSAPSGSETTAAKSATTTQSAASGAGAGKAAMNTESGSLTHQPTRGKTMASDDWSQRSAAGGVQSPRDASSGMASGKRIYKPIIIVKEVDATSPLLRQAAAKGEHIPLVELVLNEPGGRAVDYKLTDAIISSISTSSGGDLPAESISFTYAKIEWTYTKQK